MSIDKREHTRYTVELPIAVALGVVVASEAAYLSDISAGGVLFVSCDHGPMRFSNESSCTDWNFLAHKSNPCFGNLWLCFPLPHAGEG